MASKFGKSSISNANYTIDYHGYNTKESLWLMARCLSCNKFFNYDKVDANNYVCPHCKVNLKKEIF